jgi:hypothetical protein
MLDELPEGMTGELSLAAEMPGAISSGDVLSNEQILA